MMENLKANQTREGVSNSAEKVAGAEGSSTMFEKVEAADADDADKKTDAATLTSFKWLI